MTEITSIDNPTIKNIRRLHMRKYRQQEKCYILEGTRLIEDALKSNVRFKEIVVNEKYIDERNLLITAGNLKINLFKVPSRLFRELTDTQTPQGILGVTFIPESELDLKKSIIYCDKVADPGNLGTIIRTTAAAGFGGVVLSKGCVDAYNSKTVRSAMGGLFNIPIVEGEIHTLINLKGIGYTIISSSLHDSINIYSVKIKQPAVVVIGSEADGVSREIIELSDLVVKIPMFNNTESLNASVAAGILIYETIRESCTQI